MATKSAGAGTGLRIDLAGGVVRLVLNRPERRNALSEAIVAELDAALEQIADDPEARVVVLASEGAVFCSGHDLGEMIGRTEEEYRALFGRCSRMMQRLRRLPQPVIARVQGAAVAAGCQLVAACDLAVAAEHATFGTPGAKIGLFCTTPMVPLVRAVPPKAALEMLLTGEVITAERALALGLVNRVVAAGRLDDAVQELVESIVAVSSLATRLGKAAFYEGLDLDETAAYERATEVMVANALGHDAQEGMSAFLQKRRPSWTGE
jgi:enoyl-CoA hydratase/carnithine racemase